MNSHCPHFCLWPRHGFHFIFTNSLEALPWVSAPKQILENQNLIEDIGNVSSYLAVDAVDVALMRNPARLSGFNEAMIDEALEETRGKIANMFKEGAPALHDIDRDHDEEVKKLIRIFSYAIAETVCEGVEQRARIEELQSMVDIDPLTELPNRRALEKKLREEVARSDRNGPLSLLMFDLDKFKEVNDNYGHPKGDEVLRQLSHRFRNGEIGQKIMRDSDFVGRYGGDEMVFLLPSTDREGAIIAAHRITKALERDPIFVTNNETGRLVKADIGASIGIGVFEGKEVDPTGELMFIKADYNLLVLKGEKPSTNKPKGRQHRGQIAVNGEVITHEEVEAMIRQKDASPTQASEVVTAWPAISL
jgi:diguanylate cyclase (GGDEF)-like protein